MSVVGLRNAIATRIKAALPVLRACEPHGGEFTVAELDRLGGATPSVAVVCLGLAGVEDQGGQAIRRYRWGAFVVTRDVPARAEPPTPAVKKDALALALADQIVELVAYETWSDASVAACDEDTIKSRNLYSTELDSRGVTMWVVTWEQAAQPTPFDFDALDDLLRFHTSFDISKPKDDVIDSELRTEVPGPA